jgi:hypothetical protein
LAGQVGNRHKSRPRELRLQTAGKRGKILAL